jgi:uncharacterized membrane protein YidH (DUF202 family)
VSVPADPPAGRPGEDPPAGLAAQRTALAWTRTALGYAVCVLLCSRLAGTAAPLVLAAGGGAVAGLAALARARLRRAAAAVAAGRPVGSPTSVAAAAALTSALGAVAAFLIIGR